MPRTILRLCGIGWYYVLSYQWYKLGYTMKTAISLDDELLEQADKTARQMGLSRSGLFALALQDYLRHRRQQEVAEQLNRVYAGEPDAAQRRTTARMKARFRRTIRERW